METNGPIENNSKYICETCSYKCNKKSDWDKHINTKKHLGNTMETTNSHNTYTCNNCNKTYNNRSGLWKHKKKCNEIKNYDEDNISNIIINNLSNNIVDNENNKIISRDDYLDLKKLIIEVVRNNSDLYKQNLDFQKQMFQAIKATTTNISNCNINSNNQTFNLQLFLNETCKDAINMSDFINSFNLQISDLEQLAHDGYVKTLSSLIVNKVRELDVEKRPIHCTDAKREIVYIKEDDVWIKDDENKSHLRNAINKIGCKNIGILQDWQEAHPNYEKYNSPYNDVYLKLMREVIGGRDTTGNENKIIKNIIKEVVIDKQQYLK